MRPEAKVRPESRVQRQSGRKDAGIKWRPAAAGRGKARAVETQRVEHELAEEAVLVRVARLPGQRAAEHQRLLDVRAARAGQHEPPGPEKHTKQRDERHDHEPEPKQNEHLLGEHVDRQYACARPIER